MSLSDCSAIVLLSPVAHAQTSRGTVSGTVSDISGAVIFGIAIELSNVNTGIVRTTVTNPSKIYRLHAVDLGTYRIKISMQGLKGLPLLSLPSNSQCSKCFFDRALALNIESLPRIPARTLCQIAGQRGINIRVGQRFFGLCQRSVILELSNSVSPLTELGITYLIIRILRFP